MENILKFNPEKWDWYAFLNADEETKELYEHEAEHKAGNWDTCEVLPKSFSPRDSILRNLGTDFYTNLVNYNWVQARITLNSIESRVAFLLQQTDL